MDDNPDKILRTFRCDVINTQDEDKLRKVVNSFIESNKLLSTCLFREIAEKTKKAHIQGIIELSSEEHVQTLRVVIKNTFKFTTRGKYSIATIREFDSYHRYITKEGIENLWHSHNICDIKLKQICNECANLNVKKKDKVVYCDVVLDDVKDNLGFIGADGKIWYKRDDELLIKIILRNFKKNSKIFDDYIISKFVNYCRLCMEDEYMRQDQTTYNQIESATVNRIIERLL